jgi:hypothetical protein
LLTGRNPNGDQVPKGEKNQNLQKSGNPRYVVHCSCRFALSLPERSAELRERAPVNARALDCIARERNPRTTVERLKNPWKARKARTGLVVIKLAKYLR